MRFLSKKECDDVFKEPSIPAGYGKGVILVFFWIGIISAVLFRVMVIIERFNPSLSKIFWYLGVLGYLAFFIHRYNIARRRYSVLSSQGLLAKIESGETLEECDIRALRYILWSLSVSKERVNYIIISIVSVIALAISLLLDLGFIG